MATTPTVPAQRAQCGSRAGQPHVQGQAQQWHRQPHLQPAAAATRLLWLRPAAAHSSHPTTLGGTSTAVSSPPTTSQTMGSSCSERLRRDCRGRAWAGKEACLGGWHKQDVVLLPSFCVAGAARHGARHFFARCTAQQVDPLVPTIGCTTGGESVQMFTTVVSKSMDCRMHRTLIPWMMTLNAAVPNPQ